MTSASSALHTFFPALYELTNPQQKTTTGMGKVSNPKFLICTMMSTKYVM